MLERLKLCCYYKKLGALKEEHPRKKFEKLNQIKRMPRPF
jgi:hypothetical protein